MLDLVSILPFVGGVIGPIVTSLGTAVAQRIAPTSVRATNVADQVALDNSAVNFIRAKGEVENGGGESYPWVWAIIKLQRPVILALITIVYMYQEAFLPSGATESMSNSFQFVGSWLFSERFIIKSNNT